MAERRTRVVHRWLWALGAVIAACLLAFAVVVGPWLLTQHPREGLTAEQALKASNDVRTTLVQALAGLAVAGGLAVTYSTYRQNQRDQADRRAEQDRSHQLNVARHVNDLYTKAVEQLGHDQAPVRLGALYSLAQLAQANPDNRQTVVDVLCAYLRMPYTRPEDLRILPTRPEDLLKRPTHQQQRIAAQELQVRLTAQRLLADHLRAPAGISGTDAQDLEPSPNEPFWPGIRLDLNGANLIDLFLDRASIARARFYRSTFTGTTWIHQATFTGGTTFSEATFTGEATFHETTFTQGAMFHKATFKGDASFNWAALGSATFSEATFAGRATFHDVTYSKISLSEAWVLNLDHPGYKPGAPAPRCVWPAGWSICPDPDDGTQGWLVSEGPETSRGPVIPSSES
ncbi:pentapeptide repeat-containing protein [Micromonospora sp. CA-240977]|uniref:pentapeptide repeat-containing protein n=1 Tax=Micromonospora sp. CA-240977 TaxID=3239957 RepID=UPI003D913BDD